MNQLTDTEIAELHPAAQALRAKVSPAALFVADKLAEKGKASASDIGNALSLDLDTTERALGDLIRAGVAKRQAPRSDGGWVYVWTGA